MMGKWWLVTWNPYGSWLPGDARGFKTWRKRRPISQSPDYNPADYAREFALAKVATKHSVKFNREQRQSVLDAISDDIEQLTVVPAILAVADVHVHLLAKFGSLKIRPTVGRLRSAATQELHNSKLIEQQRIWAKGCHMESLPTEEAFLQAFEYVRQHEEQGAAIRTWRLEYADDVLPD